MSAPDPAFEARVSAGPIVDSASDQLWGPNGQPDWQTCPDRDGDCMVTVTRERAGYLDEDVDVACVTCDATGRVQDA